MADLACTHWKQQGITDTGVSDTKYSWELKSGYSEVETFKGKVSFQSWKLNFSLLFLEKIWLISFLHFFAESKFSIANISISDVGVSDTLLNSYQIWAWGSLGLISQFHFSGKFRGPFENKKTSKSWWIIRWFGFKLFYHGQWVSN